MHVRRMVGRGTSGARRLLVGRLLVVGLALSAVSGCGAGPMPPPGQPAASPVLSGATAETSAHEPPAGQAPSATAPTASGGPIAPLTWAACGDAECATLRVPLDYGQPAGPSLALSVKRLKATATPRLGTIFVNPGGPGGSGTAFASGFARRGLEQFDIVGWDPRGAGGDSAVTCLDGPATDAYLALDFSPDTPPESTALTDGSRAYGAACAASGLALLAHVSTQDSARDLDALRAAVGEEKLTFYGASYGTLLGALYAQLFPDKVGRMVLDSASEVTGHSSVPQVQGFERALGGFASWCSQGNCRWGATSDAVVASLTAWVNKLDQAPLRVGGRTLTQSLAAYGVASLLYSGATGYVPLKSALEAGMAGDGAPLLEASDRLFGRAADGRYAPSFSAAQAITCADQPRKTDAEAATLWARDRSLAPFFGTFFGPDVACDAWPTPPAPWVVPRAAGTPTILVIGATGDPATPYEWAKTMAATLASGRLLTYEGFGHVSYGGRSACIDADVRRYFITGDAPAPDTHCS